MSPSTTDLKSILSHLDEEALSALIQLGSNINSSLHLNEVLNQVMGLLDQFLNCEASSLLLLDENKKKLTFHTATGSKASKFKNMTLSLGEGIAGWVANTGKPAMVNDVDQDKRYEDKADLKSGFHTRSLLCVPIKAKETLIGVLEAINKKENGAFNEIDLQLLKILADQAAIAIQNAKTYELLYRNHENLQQELNTRYTLIGDSEPMNKIMDICQKVAKGNSTVLIRGRSGTGKEMHARTIHNSSARKDKPFITIICSILSQSLLESELFGHEKGAFTGAEARKIGRFEMANGGTLFLDEIGTLSQETQLRLLRVLQEKSFERVGGTETIHVDVRIIAATNADLEKEIEAGRFREDLYYRLKVIEILLPDLKDRSDDILPLANYYLEHFSNEMGRSMEGFSPEAIKLLKKYSWPGNIRELKNSIERCVVLANTNKVEVEDLDITPSASKTISPDATSLEDAEKIHITKILLQTHWNKSKAAGLLGVSRNRLDRKIEGYNISKE